MTLVSACIKASIFQHQNTHTNTEMDLKHFSHPHNLSFHQLPQQTQMNCSGCKLPAKGNAYMCWPCQFFLHEQCFQAIRSIIHSSHPSHPLTLIPYPTYQSGSFLCNSCSQTGTGFSYSCSNCEFDLHVHCASHIPKIPHKPYPNNQPNFCTQYDKIPEIPAHESHPNSQHFNQSNRSVPNATGAKHLNHLHPLHLSKIEGDNLVDCSGCGRNLSGSAFICTETSCKFQLHQACCGLPPKLQHKSHPEHPITLLTSPSSRGKRGFTCNACFSKGTALSYHCSTCNYDLHVDCAFLPEKVSREDHHHSLDLHYCTTSLNEKYKVEDVVFSCDACQKIVDIQHCWFYYCQKCDYGTHLDCVTSKVSPEEEKLSKENLLSAARVRLHDQSALNSLGGAYYFNGLNYPITITSEVSPEEEKLSEENLLSAARVRLHDQSAINSLNAAFSYNNLHGRNSWGGSKWGAL